MLKKWFWKDGATDVSAVDVWQKTCQYLYFPRLSKSTTLQSAIAAGSPTHDFFGLAYGKLDDNYTGFCFGCSTTPLMESLLLIEPMHAAEYDVRSQEAESRAKVEAEGKRPTSSTIEVTGTGTESPTTNKTEAQRPVRYYASANLDPVKAALEFQKLVTEVVSLFTAKPGSVVRLRVDIEADDARGFDENTVRAAKENAKVLGMTTSEFE